MADHSERIGQMIGDYRLLRWLGGGGFGNVYLAEQVHDGSQVAIKVLQIRLTRSDDFRAFLNEARTMRLRHPHIMPLLDFGLSGEDMPFLVMEYAAKGTLRDRHPKGQQVPLLMVVEYAIQIAAALQYAHDQRLIHHDVKPENMLLRDDEMILLSDFGIAAAAHSTHSSNVNQGIGGTVPYMAPEQLEGKTYPQSDQYALAIVIYEWLTGRCPFLGSAIEVGMQHALEPPPSLLAQVPGLPSEVEEVIFKGLAKDPKDRFASVRAFATALQQASSRTGFYNPAFSKIQLSRASITTARPVTNITATQSSLASAKQSEVLSINTTAPGETLSFAPRFTHNVPTTPITSMPARPLAHKSGRSRGYVALMIVIVMVLLIGGGGYTYSTVQHIQATATVKGIQRDATIAAVRQRDATATAKGIATATALAPIKAYNTYIAQHGIMFGFNVQHTNANPYEHILNVANVSQLRQKWVASPGGIVGSSPAVANGIVYVGSTDSKLYAFDVTNGTQKWVAFTGYDIYSSPAVVNGVVYVGSTDGKLYAFDAATGTQKWASSAGSQINSSPAVVNGIVYVGSFDGKLYAFDAATGAQKWASSAGDVVESSPAVANGIVYVGSIDGKLYAFDAANGTQKWAATTGNVIYSSPAVANGVVYVGSYDHKLYAFDAATGTQKWTALTGNFIYSSPAVANGIVYVGSFDDKLYAFDAATGTQKWAASTGNVIYSSPAVANGVIYVGSTDGKLYAFDATTGTQKWTTSIGNNIGGNNGNNNDNNGGNGNGNNNGGNNNGNGNGNGNNNNGGNNNGGNGNGNGNYGSFFAVVDRIDNSKASDGKLPALDMVYGQQEWIPSSGGSATPSPTIANGVVYIGSVGKLYAFSLPGNGS